MILGQEKIFLGIRQDHPKHQDITPRDKIRLLWDILNHPKNSQYHPKVNNHPWDHVVLSQNTIR